MPAQVQGLSQATVRRATVFSDTAGDNLMLEVTLPRGVHAVLIAYIERALVPSLRDAFVVGESLEQVHGHFRRIMAEDGNSLDEVMATLELAQARAALAQALDAAPPRTEPDPRGGEQWPMLRSFVEFVLCLMPAGGAGYDSHGMLVGTDLGLLDDPALGDAGDPRMDAAGESPPWVLGDGTDLVPEFLASEQAAGHEHGEVVAQLAMYFFIVAHSATGDPLHWSRDLAAWLAGTILPSDPVLSEAALRHVPAVLPALIRWSHARTGTEPDQTQVVLQTIAPLLEDLLARRADPRMRARQPEERIDLALESEDPGEVHRADLVLRVDGDEQLANLDSTPLPAEELGLDAIAEDLRERALEMDAHLVDGLPLVNSGLLPVDAPLLGQEFLTACRRFLVRIAQLADTVLRRRASARTTAGAIAWIVGRGNELVGHPPAPIRTGDLLRGFDIRSTPSQRSESLMRAAALPHSPVGIYLADPALLVASEREEILRIRDVLDTM